MISIYLTCSKIFIGGDSAGGHATLSLISHILHPHPDLSEDLRVQLPGPLAGAILTSPWVKFTTDDDSVKRNRGSDFVCETGANRWSAAFMGRCRVILDRDRIHTNMTYQALHLTITTISLALRPKTGSLGLTRLSRGSSFGVADRRCSLTALMPLLRNSRQSIRRRSMSGRVLAHTWVGCLTSLLESKGERRALRLSRAGWLPGFESSLDSRSLAWATDDMAF